MNSARSEASRLNACYAVHRDGLLMGNRCKGVLLVMAYLFLGLFEALAGISPPRLFMPG